MKVLFATSEVWPLIKTGGLGDVSYSLPHALQEKNLDVRLVLPAYRDVLNKLDSFKTLGWLSINLGGSNRDVRILEATHEQFKMPIWLVDAQHLFDREGNPYSHSNGYDWPDNAERFTLFSQAVAALSLDKLDQGWKADVVHCNDWQTGLVAAFLDHEPERPRRVFTIHNLAYSGSFSKDEYDRLRLPSAWWSMEGVEFYGNLSMLKAGIVYSDAVTTVSPTYAKEICTAEFGYGLEGVLSSRSYKLTGILNGIDTNVWNPSTDTLIPFNFTAQRRNPSKQKNKKALLESYGVTAEKEQLDAPLLGLVSRLVEQKGIDMVLEAIPTILDETTARIVIIGTGHTYIEAQLKQLNQKYPDRVLVTIGYDEEKAHLLEAGCDIFLMPSRFEPCGLNQMYSLSYGTLPIVNRTGGLADTVVDADEANGEESSFKPNGFVLEAPNTAALIKTIQRALSLYENKKSWQQLQRNAMTQDFSWEKSANAYIEIYNN
ncbi:glycogen synthase GlgA [Cocleimonas sp. KMM 6892]|uniref:glycogen synthase GlgA n=1 Tax=unclassified Cocleimonas TaxID=2639732 RepID=UPI002DB9E26A|nr:MULTISPECIES: glycogen synthase GlgA [unclassified Cocleimonas]MEB8433755.1 glycogen synthase GlgA [Cocleimonas sp. KMM 6892]MEC4716566.1 glycogen synthase GlgA [Cocleimonas sp. KMM 6895]MEC4746279.1 glycogen synthase GlgA [Cocleimonas sp. KMM 6896]